MDDLSTLLCSSLTLLLFHRRSLSLLRCSSLLLQFYSYTQSHFSIALLSDIPSFRHSASPMSSSFPLFNTSIFVSIFYFNKNVFFFRINKLLPLYWLFQRNDSFQIQTFGYYSIHLFKEAYFIHLSIQYCIEWFEARLHTILSSLTKRAVHPQTELP